MTLDPLGPDAFRSDLERYRVRLGEAIGAPLTPAVAFALRIHLADVPIAVAEARMTELELGALCRLVAVMRGAAIMTAADIADLVNARRRPAGGAN